MTVLNNGFSHLNTCPNLSSSVTRVIDQQFIKTPTSNDQAMAGVIMVSWPPQFDALTICCHSQTVMSVKSGPVDIDLHFV